MWRYVEDESKKGNEATVGGRGGGGRKGTRPAKQMRGGSQKERPHAVRKARDGWRGGGRTHAADVAGLVAVVASLGGGHCARG